MIPIPNILPTDNLYKFFFIGGIVTILVSSILLVIQYSSHYEKLFELDKSMLHEHLEDSFYLADVNRFTNELIKKEKRDSAAFKSDSTYGVPQSVSDFTSRILKDKNYRDYLEFMFKHQSELFPILEGRDKMRQENEKLNETEKKRRMNLLNIKLENERYDIENKFLKILLVVWGIFMFLGIVMLYYGYLNWFHRVQRPTDEKLQIDLQQSRIDLEHSKLEFIKLKKEVGIFKSY